MSQLQIERIKNVILDFDYYNMVDECTSEHNLISQIECTREIDIINYLLDLIDEF